MWDVMNGVLIPCRACVCVFGEGHVAGCPTASSNHVLFDSCYHKNDILCIPNVNKKEPIQWNFYYMFGCVGEVLRPMISDAQREGSKSAERVTYLSQIYSRMVLQVLF